MRELRSALVLGGAGFIGRSIVSALKARGVKRVVVDDLSTGDPRGVDVDEFIVSSVKEADLAGLIRAHRIDVVFHLASRAYVPPSFDQPLEDMERNAGTTLLLLEAVRQLRLRPLLVCASSAAVYGEGIRLPMAEDHPLRPLSPYGISKYAAEQYVRLYSQLYGLPALCLRLFSVYGPGQRKQVVYDLARRALEGEKPLTVLGAPDVTRDLVFVDDAASAFVDLAQRAPAQGEAYNIASGRPTSLATLVDRLLEAIGLDLPVRFTGEVRPGDPRYWQGDPARAAAYGVDCRTPLSVGLRRTVQWITGNRAFASSERNPTAVAEERR